MQTIFCDASDVLSACVQNKEMRPWLTARNYNLPHPQESGSHQCRQSLRLPKAQPKHLINYAHGAPAFGRALQRN